MKRAVSIAAVIGFVGIGEARADEFPDAGKSVLVVPFTGVGTDSERLQLSLAAIRGVRSARAKVELAQTSAADLIAINGCAANDSDCLATIPAALGVDVVVFGKLSGSGERQVVLVRVEAGGRSRSAGKATAVESQAAALFGVRAKEAGGGEKNGAGGNSDGGGNSSGPFSGGYTGDLGGRGALDNNASDPAGPANYGRRDGKSFDFGQVERYAWGMTIGGGAAVGVGVVLLIFGDSVQGDIEDAPTNTADQLDDLEEKEDRARLLYGFGNGLAVAGLVTAAVGGALILYQATREGPEAAATTPPATELGVTPLRGGAMVTFGVRR